VHGGRSDAHERMMIWDDLELMRPGAYEFCRVAAHTLGLINVIFEVFAEKIPYKSGCTHTHVYPGIVITRDHLAEPWYVRWTYVATRKIAIQPRDHAVGFVSVVDRLSGLKNQDREGQGLEH
jgi:hypothetical protein